MRKILLTLVALVVLTTGAATAQAQHWGPRGYYRGPYYRGPSFPAAVGYGLGTGLGYGVGYGVGTALVGPPPVYRYPVYPAPAYGYGPPVYGPPPGYAVPYGYGGGY
jgi:opacity protein-like surface antigen